MEKAKVILTQLREKSDKNGNTYFIGDLAMGTITMFKHKTKDGVWNVFLSQKDFEKKQENNPPVESDDVLPF